MHLNGPNAYMYPQSTFPAKNIKVGFDGVEITLASTHDDKGF